MMILSVACLDSVSMGDRERASSVFVFVEPG